MPDPCYCKAYPFPHRPGSGGCLGPGDVVCSQCGDVTEGYFTDLGIGAYEYWGSKGVDTDIRFVSRCCDASMTENTAKADPVTPPPYRKVFL